MARPKVVRYWLNQRLRHAIKWIIRFLTAESDERPLKLHSEKIDKILLVRATFRMGDSILAAPAVSLFRKRFPNARIDFVGSPISRTLFRNLPLDRHFNISRRFPDASWAYLVLIRRIRSMKYDLAVDLSCSQSAMGSFVVGFSGARFRVGLKGEWDRWFNVRIPRPPERNKYNILPAFLAAVGLRKGEILPLMLLSPAEMEEGKRKIEALVGERRRRTVGVFVGGRKAWKKRWPIKSFCELITALYGHGMNVVTFFGPEERNLIGFFNDALDPGIPLVFSASPGDFASMVSNCDLFITCDSGPMHLAAALGTRTVALFQHPDFYHWGLPSSMGRIVYQPGGCSFEEVLRICLLELFHGLGPGPGEVFSKSSALALAPNIEKTVRRLDKSLFIERLAFIRTYTQALFCLGLIVYTSFFPPSLIFKDGTWMEAFTNAIGIGSIMGGSFLHLWAVSHGGAANRSRRTSTLRLLTEGPYAYIRHPIYMANFIMGAGLIFLSEAFVLAPLFLALFALQHKFIVPAEEDLLREKLGEGFDLYGRLVPRYIPWPLPSLQLSFGKFCSVSELAVLSTIMLVGFFFEWIESPLHHNWLLDFYRLLVG
jgi:heptosyltransferase-3